MRYAIFLISLALIVSGCSTESGQIETEDVDIISKDEKLVYKTNYACSKSSECIITYNNNRDCCPLYCGEIVNSEEVKKRADWKRANCDYDTICAKPECPSQKVVPKCRDSVCVGIESA